METMFAWLAAITWPLVSRVLLSLGFGYVTYEGATAALGGAIGAAKAAMGGLVGDVASILAIAGLFDVASITAGGLVGSITWMVAKRMVLTNTGAQ